jgi:hypothetical protein
MKKKVKTLNAFAFGLILKKLMEKVFLALKAVSKSDGTASNSKSKLLRGFF